MENINYKTIEINETTLTEATNSIINFANSRKLTIVGELNLIVPSSFPSLSKRKVYRNALQRVINKPTMKNVNVFLHFHSKLTETPSVKLDYSEKEKSIKSARAHWKTLHEEAEKARIAYRETKGDFYK